MFKTFLEAELKYALKQPMVYIFFGLMALFTFGATASDNIVIGGPVGNIYKNAPHIITVYTTIMTIFGLLIATAFYNNAALRDYNYNFNEILFSTPLSKAGYFFGRFSGGLILATLPMLGIFCGVWLGTLLATSFGWIAPGRFGEFYLETFINNYFIFILPNMFFAGSLIFALANKFKNTTVSFVGILIIIIGYIIAGVLMSDLENETLAALVDTFGIRAYSIYTKYYTPVEKNTLSPSFSGILLFNRLIWVCSGAVILGLGYLSFSFQVKKQKIKADKETKIKPKLKFTLPQFTLIFNWKTHWLHFKTFFQVNFLNIVKNDSGTFKILFLFSVIILISNLIGRFEYFGLQAYPLTYKLIDTISNVASIFVVIILVFFSGELVWRDRESKINEVIDATPHGSFISLLAKTLALLATASILHLLFILISIFYQLFNGYTRLELDVYLRDLFYTNFWFYFSLGGISILIQVLVNNKYIGYFITIMLIFIWELVLIVLDVKSNMLIIGGGPQLIYSDMNGFGPGLTSALWFNLYWSLFAFLCLCSASVICNRGQQETLKNRLKYALRTLSKTHIALITGLKLVWLSVFAFVFYNTQILNTYKTSDELELSAVEYEQKYKKYQNTTIPKITNAQYFIDLFPYRRDVYVKAILELTNESDQPIDSLHFTIDPDWKPQFDIPNAELIYEDKELNYLIYKLAPALQPGQSIETSLQTAYLTKGFENSAGNTNVVKNGTFLNNFEILPVIGYNESNELRDKNKRQKYGLKPKDRMPELESNCSTNCMQNYLTYGRSDYINVETIMSTAADQIAIAPGSLQKKWQEDNRNYYHYKVDHPSQNFYAFISGKYQIATRRWNNVDLEIYHDAKHPWNIEMMLDAVERSLIYYTENFGPYYHKQCRIVEFPRYASFGQAFPGTMPYSEALGFVINLEDKTENNIIDAVIAHEMSHQWWGHQVLGAFMQGSTMFSESFAEYSSLMTMKKIAQTPMKIRQFLKYNHDRYLRGRSRETDKELPLYKVENQQHIHYGKGSLILYALQDYIGEAKVNAALRGFLAAFKYRPPPYPTSLDFLTYLEPQVPDSLKYLISDWIKDIVLYDNRMQEAYYKKLPNGKYQTTVKIKAAKMKADTIGNETEMALDDWIDIGFFGDPDEEKLVFEQRVKIDQNDLVFTFDLDSLPLKAAIDPRRLLIERVYSDNIKTVQENETDGD